MNTWRPAIILLLLVCSLVLAPQPTTAQTINVTPPVGLSGTEFAFFASGFFADERVVYWVNVPNGRVNGNAEDFFVFADASGIADWRWRAPPGAIPGTWVMVAQGRESGLTLRIAFEIRPTGSNVPDSAQQTTVDPAIGPPGTRFFFTARGFNSREPVFYWLTAPNGTTVSSGDFEVAASDGRAVWSWQSPINVQRGVWLMAARGNNSGIERVIRFEIR